MRNNRKSIFQSNSLGGDLLALGVSTSVIFTALIAGSGLGYAIVTSLDLQAWQKLTGVLLGQATGATAGILLARKLFNNPKPL